MASPAIISLLDGNSQVLLVPAVQAKASDNTATEPLVIKAGDVFWATFSRGQGRHTEIPQSQVRVATAAEIAAAKFTSDVSDKTMLWVSLPASLEVNTFGTLPECGVHLNIGPEKMGVGGRQIMTPFVFKRLQFGPEGIQDAVA